MSSSGIINHPLRDEPGLKTKQINDHPRSSVNTREVSEGSRRVSDTLRPALLVLMARCKTRKAFTSTRCRTGEYSSPAKHVREQGASGNVCVTGCLCEYSREHSRVYVQQETSSTAVGIIQYREGTPHRVVISVLLYSDHVGFRKYESSPTRRARTENKTNQ